jgi:phage terminase small subunit
MKKLSAKQKRFCEEYLVDLNATQAAIRAGYSLKTANRIASQNLSKLDIQENIRLEQQKLTEKADITKAEVMNELAFMLRAKISDYCTFNGSTLQWKSFDDLTEAQIKAIESIKQTANGIELKLHGKNWTIERISKMLGFDDGTDVNLNFKKWNEESLDVFLDKLIKRNGENKS